MKVSQNTGRVREGADERWSCLDYSLVSIVEADCLDYFRGDPYYVGSCGGIVGKTCREALVDIVAEVLIGGSLKPDRGTVSRIDNFIGVAVAEVGTTGGKLRESVSGYPGPGDHRRSDH